MLFTQSIYRNCRKCLNRWCSVHSKKCLGFSSYFFVTGDLLLQLDICLFFITLLPFSLPFPALFSLSPPCLCPLYMPTTHCFMFISFAGVPLQSIRVRREAAASLQHTDRNSSRGHQPGEVSFTYAPLTLIK